MDSSSFHWRALHLYFSCLSAQAGFFCLLMVTFDEQGFLFLSAFKEKKHFFTFFILIDPGVICTFLQLTFISLMIIFLFRFGQSEENRLESIHLKGKIATTFNFICLPLSWIWRFFFFHVSSLELGMNLCHKQSLMKNIKVRKWLSFAHALTRGLCFSLWLCVLYST